MNRGAVTVPGSFPIVPARGAWVRLGMGSGMTDRPGLVLAIGAAITAVLIALEIGYAGSLAWLAEDAHLLVAAGSGILALIIMARRRQAQSLDYRPLALGCVLTGGGMAGVELVPVFGQPATVLANVLIVVGVSISLTVILPALYRPSDARTRAAEILDSVIMTGAGTTLVVTVWRSGSGTEAPLDQFLVPILAACLLAMTSMPMIAAFSRRIAPRPRGIWSAGVGSAVLAWCWILWLDASLHGRPNTELVAICYSVGILILVWSWLSWEEITGSGRVYVAIAQRVTDWMPAGAVLVCVTIAALPHGTIGPVDPAYIGAVVVVSLTLLRQRLLILNERDSSRLLAREVEERAQTMLSLSRLESGATLEATASRICREAMRLDGIESAAVYAFAPSGSVVPLALYGCCSTGQMFGGPEEVVGEPVELERNLHLKTEANTGPWVDFHAAGPAEARRVGPGGEPATAGAFAPMRWDDRVVGVVAMGTDDREQIRRLADRLPTLSEFGVVSGALMGPMLAEHWRMSDLRAQLDEVINTHAFWPVFQSVVRLANRKPVGYEALTRFADGSRPDERFAQANAADMSVRFETACLQSQLEAATWLPAGAWLSLNVSPALAMAVVPLVSAVELADRDVVLEITEHVAIGDYEMLDKALNLVRGRVRLAVDDAGAGYAGLRHILELRPHFVKLDISLVRNIDTDEARQAMVAGMAHFARNSHCELIAEGVETEAELAQLIRLGVTYGQGYLFDHPAPVGELSEFARGAA